MQKSVLLVTDEGDRIFFSRPPFQVLRSENIEKTRAGLNPFDAEDIWDEFSLWRECKNIL